MERNPLPAVLRGPRGVLPWVFGLTVCVAPVAAQSGEPFTFDHHEIVIGTAARQTVLTGLLLGDVVADVAVVHIDENDDRRLRIYGFGEGGWTPRTAAILNPGVVFVDVANIGGRDRLITYQRGRLQWFDPQASTERPLVVATSNFAPPRHDEVPHVDVTHDVNDDDRDDLVVPDDDGFWVYVQRGDGTFANPIQVGSPPNLAGIYGADGYRYDPWGQSRIHAVDSDGDRRTNLVYWNEDRFVVHRQGRNGRFGVAADSFTTAVVFDSDDPLSLATGDATGTVLHSLSDLSGDQIPDLVTYSLEGQSTARKSSRFEVHLGTLTTDGRMTFAPEVHSSFRSDGQIHLGMDRHDFDSDGDVDLIFTTIAVGSLENSLWKRIRGFMGDDIWLELEFYRSEDGAYPVEPTATRRIQLDGSPSHREPGWVPLDIVLRGGLHEARRTQDRYRRAFNRALLIGDVTGDGHTDLLVERTHERMSAYAGVPGPDLFVSEPQEIVVAIPNDAEYSWLVDLNRDGKQDIVMHHPFIERNAHGAPQRPPGTESQRVTILIAH